MGDMADEIADLAELYEAHREAEQEPVNFVFEFLRETERAIHVRYADDEFWLPKSQITYDIGYHMDGPDTVRVTLPTWLAIDKGLA